MYLINIYISTRNGSTLERLALFRKMLTEALGEDNFELEVLSVLENPDAAISDDILVTPTIIRRNPAPIRKVVGNFLDREKLFFGLELDDTTSPDSKIRSN